MSYSSSGRGPQLALPRPRCMQSRVSTEVVTVLHAPDVAVGVVEAREVDGAVGGYPYALALAVGELQPACVGALTHGLCAYVVLTHGIHGGVVETHEGSVLAVLVVLYRATSVPLYVLKARGEHRLEAETRQEEVVGGVKLGAHIHRSVGIEHVCYVVRCAHTCHCGHETGSHGECLVVV